MAKGEAPFRLHKRPTSKKERGLCPGPFVSSLRKKQQKGAKELVAPVEALLHSDLRVSPHPGVCALHRQTGEGTRLPERSCTQLSLRSRFGAD
jgi:hypothetical protein